MKTFTQLFFGGIVIFFGGLGGLVIACFAGIILAFGGLAFTLYRLGYLLYLKRRKFLLSCYGISVPDYDDLTMDQQLHFVEADIQSEKEFLGTVGHVLCFWQKPLSTTLLN
ncbi:hypothetical protein KKH82_05215 [Patescibacteria group bacterium]|nr:hypothetical protein [Patescibacteria group bacterium]